jgi:hypothetical protein
MEAREFADEAGRELARRVDWSALASTTSFVGRGSDFAFLLPEDFDRFQRGATITFGSNIVRPLTRAEWNTLTMFQGQPRYFLLENRNVRFWPFVPNGTGAVGRYQSKNWVTSGSVLNASRFDRFMADSNETLLDENILTMGLIVRWRRQKGMPFDDFEAEYEAALRDVAGFDRRARF